MPRRLPAPWKVEDTNDACFIVRDADGTALAYCYYDAKPHHGTGGNLDRETARRLASRIRKIPET